MPPRVTITGLDGIPEVRPGADLAALILGAVAASGETLQDGDLIGATPSGGTRMRGRSRWCCARRRGSCGWSAG